MKILIAYATTDGHSRAVANWIAHWLRTRDHYVRLLDTSVADDNELTDREDAYILIGSVHFGKHQPSLVRFAIRHLSMLRHARTALVSVSMVAAKGDEKGRDIANSYVDAFVTSTGWKPKMTLAAAGALLYTQYGPIKKWVMKKISKHEERPTDTSRDYDFTDWNALENFLTEFAGTNQELTPRDKLLISKG